MGKIKQGLLGPVSGKVGNVIGSSWRGIHYLRIVPANVNDPQTVPQLNQRSKFMVVLRFIQPLLTFLRVGFRSFGIRMSAYNAAMSYNLRNAVEGIFPDFHIDYTKALVSRGNLRDVEGAVASSIDPGSVVVNWSDNSGLGNASADDEAIIVVFNQDLMDMQYTLQAAQRSDTTAEIILPDTYSGSTVHVYLVFSVHSEYASNGSRDTISDSCYAGSVLVA